MKLLGLAALWLSTFAVGSARAAIYTWMGGTSSDWETASNWNGSKLTSGTTSANRLNLGTTASSAGPLIYTATQGTTLLNPNDRGLTIYRASTMEIQGGTFSTSGTAADVVGLTAATATLTIDGGTYNSNSGLTVGFNSHGVFNINSGAATISTLKMSEGGNVANNGTLNLNGGTLSVNGIAANNPTAWQTTTVLLNGGMLIARQDNTAFISTLLVNLRVGTSGAKIDTAGFNVTIAKALTPGVDSTGGLTKYGLGTLTLSGVNTYTGGTQVTAGTLALTGSGSIANSTLITVDADAALDVSGTTSGSFTIGSGVTLGGDGALAGNFVFGSGAQLAFTAGQELEYTGADITFDTNFGIQSLIGLTSDVTPGTYTLISGNVDLTGVNNVGLANAYDLGNGKLSYFQDDSGLKLVVLPNTQGTVISIR